MNAVPKEARQTLYLVMGKSAHGVVALLDKWVQESGVEWTSSRLKAIRTATLQLRAGNRDKVRAIYQENSISYHRRSLYPKGPMGKIVKSYLLSKRPVAIRRWDACLRLYTVLRCTQLTHTQRQKAYKAISAPYGGRVDLLSKLSRQLESLVRAHNWRLPKIARPDIGNLKAFSSTHRTIPVPEDLRGKAYASLATSLLTSVWIPQSLQGVNPCEELRQQLLADGASDDVAGHISFIQEGGCKARVVAVPNAWCQWLFQPLHRSLDKLIQGLPNSAVHDQTAGGYYLMEHLQKGCWCFDLSSATDRFPLELQQGVLRGLGLSLYADAIGEISRYEWLFQSEKISWGAGQPMGLYSSFPLFHLTHWCLLELICKQLNRDIGSFYVLGDDVVISDQKVASLYNSVLAALDVPVSPLKSIASRRVGEFAGFVVTTTNRQVTAYRPFKYAKVGGRVHPLNLMYSLGSKVTTLSPWWSKTYKLFESTLSSRLLDLSPILVQDEEEGSVPTPIDSHFLGSLVNRICYDLPFTPSAEFDAIWPQYRCLLLGQKEIVDSEGIPLKNLNPLGVSVPEEPEEELHSFSDRRVWDDPLMREARDKTVPDDSPTKTCYFTPR